MSATVLAAAIRAKKPSPVEVVQSVYARPPEVNGRISAFKVSDFDWDVLRVRRRIYEGKADTTKTEKSARDLAIPDVPPFAAAVSAGPPTERL